MPNDQLKTFSIIFFIRNFYVSVKNLFRRGFHSSHNFCLCFFLSVFLEFFWCVYMCVENLCCRWLLQIIAKNQAQQQRQRQRLASNLSGSRRATSLSNLIIIGLWANTTHIALGLECNFIISMHNIIIGIVDGGGCCCCSTCALSVHFHCMWMRPYRAYMYVYIYTYFTCACVCMCIYKCICMQSALTALQRAVYSNWIFARDFRSLNPTAKSRKAPEQRL